MLADRDGGDVEDVFRCLDAATGKEQWRLTYAAPGELDYGNAPRATPLIEGDRVFVLGAFGHLHALELATGAVLWKKDLAVDYLVDPPTWGLCGSPLIADGKLIVQPGAEAASLVALDPASGKEIWRCPGRAASYASFIVATFAGVRQLIGYDAETLGGWDIKTGRRLWELRPPHAGDFNVPTPIQLGDRLLVTTENNGTRLYAFDAKGCIVEKPVASHAGLAPDTSSLVVAGNRVFGGWSRLYCLDAGAGLRETWADGDAAFADYVSLIASATRLLVTTVRGELLLYDAASDQLVPKGRLQPFADEVEVYAHPAVVGDRLYVRHSRAIVCLALRGEG